MKEFQQKHLFRTLLYSPATFVILFLILVLLLRSNMELNDKRIEVSKLRDESILKKNDLQNKLNYAQVKNNFIHTSYGLEDYIRNTQPVTKEGEGVIVIYDASSSLVSSVKKDMTFWEHLTIFLQGLF